MRTLCLLAVVSATAGCQSRLTGNEGNFVFSYWADDDINNFNKPIAVGAWLEVEVHTVGGNQSVDLASASFDDPAVLNVSGFSGNTVTVEGTGDGSALLSVADGAGVTDSVNMLAATPEVVRLRHSCSDSDSAAYLVDQRFWVPFEMEKANGQPVIGRGYQPVNVDGAASLDGDDSTQQHLALDADAVGGSLTISSQVDDTSLTANIVLATDVDGIAEPIAYVVEDIDVGDKDSFYVRPTVGADVLCQANMSKSVSSDTPEICSVTDRDAEVDATDELAWEFGWFEIEGLAGGECLYTVTFDASGISAQFSYPIEP